MGRSVPSATSAAISDEKISGCRSAQTTSSCRATTGRPTTGIRPTGHWARVRAYSACGQAAISGVRGFTSGSGDEVGAFIRLRPPNRYLGAYPNLINRLIQGPGDLSRRPPRARFHCLRPDPMSSRARSLTILAVSLLASVLLVEIVVRVYFARQIGARTLLYGTRWHRQEN